MIDVELSYLISGYNKDVAEDLYSGVLVRADW